MPSETTRKLLITLMLGSLTISAFFIRLENFKNSPNRSIDEIVYYRMGKQILTEGLAGYNTIPYGREMAATGRPLPQYFFEPLFKHPPLFTFLITLSMKIFGPILVSAEYVSLLFGVLLIPSGYILGAVLFNRRVGLLSAFFLWLDPVTIMCSQKVWMETTIAFFTLLSAVFFAKGIKSNNDWFLILSGVSTGLAANTKYPALLITVALFCYVFLYHKQDLFLKRKFWLSIILPFLFLLPWMYWNHQVYGFKAIVHHEELIELYRIVSRHWHAIVLLGTILAIFLWIGYKFRLRRHTAGIRVPLDTSTSLKTISVLVILALGVLLKDYLWRSLHLTSLPSVSWAQGTFANEPPFFYIGRLIEYSFFYVFAFIAVFIYRPSRDAEIALLRIPAVMILLFYIAWGNYQSRYILACIPFLIILGAQFWVEKFEMACSSKKRLIYLGGAGLTAILVYSILKTHIINLSLSYTNNMCYF